MGSLTHGRKPLDQVTGNADVAVLFDAGWVSMDMVPQIALVRERLNFISYGPLREAIVDPDVVLLRLNGKHVTIAHDAVPELRFQGQPQCHISAIAKELDQGTRSGGGKRRLHAEPGANRHVQQRDDRHHPRTPSE